MGQRRHESDDSRRFFAVLERIHRTIKEHKGVGRTRIDAILKNIKEE